MGMKTRVSLIVLMVVLVAGIVIYDRKFGSSTEPKTTDPATAVAMTTPPGADPFASLAPVDPAGTPPPATATDPFATGTSTPAGTPPPSTGPSTGISAPPPTSGPSTPTTDLASAAGTRTKPAGNPFLDPAPTTKPPDTKGGKKGGKEPKASPVSTTPFDTTPPPPVSTPIDRPVTPLGGKTHKVREGESLWTIAEDYYKDGTKFKAIEEANKDRLGSGGFLKVGMDLVIPEVASAASSTSSPVAPVGTKEAVAGPGEYKVKSGDSLATIAREQLGSEGHWELIAKANEDKLEGKPNRLKVGMILRIPEKPAKAEKAAPKPGKTPELKEEPVPADLAGKRTYRIKSGDSLWTIAEREMGGGTKWEKLYEANKSRLPNRADLKVGQVIVIPDDVGPSTR